MCSKNRDDLPLVAGGQGRSAEEIEGSAYVIGWLAFAAFVAPIFIFGDALVDLMAAIALIGIAAYLIRRAWEKKSND